MPTHGGHREGGATFKTEGPDKHWISMKSIAVYLCSLWFPNKTQTFRKWERPGADFGSIDGPNKLFGCLELLAQERGFHKGSS